MHVEVVTYDRGMMSEQDYIDFAHQLAPRVASVPGLMAAVWLDGAETGLYGGIFFWEDHSSMERFTDSRLFQSAFGPFGDVIIGHADVLENVTQVSQPMLQIIPPKDGQEAASLPASSDQSGQGGASRKALSAKKGLSGKKSATTKKATVKTAASPNRPASGKKRAAAKPATSRKSATAKKAAAPAKSGAGRKRAASSATGKKASSGARASSNSKPKGRAKR